MLKYFMGVVVVTALVLGLAGTAMAFTVTSSQDLNDYANLVGGGETIVPQANVYDWADIDGAGTDASANLDLGANYLRTYRVYNTETQTDIRLRLNGGDLTGTGSELPASGYRNSSRPAGLTSLSTYTYPDYQDRIGAAHIVIEDVRDISVAKIISGSNGADSATVYNYDAGNVSIGSTTSYARDIRVDSFDLRAISRGDGGTLTIYSSANVRIQDTGGTTLGSIDARGWGAAGRILVRHSGEFRALDILADGAAASNDPRVVFNGNFGGGGASGGFTIRNLDTDVSGNYTGGNEISGYTAVNIDGDVSMRNTSTYAWNRKSPYAPDLSITGITGDISVDGAINLNATAGDSYDGELKLACGGTITLASLDCSLFKTPSSGYVFDAGNSPGDIFIKGELLNVDVDDATISQLSAPAGDVIYYYAYDHPVYGLAANKYLFDNDIYDGVQDGIWALASGGTLQGITIVPEPAGLGLVGLALLGLRKKRS